jgi:rare lipoprotein A
MMPLPSDGFHEWNFSARYFENEECSQKQNALEIHGHDVFQKSSSAAVAVDDAGSGIASIYSGRQTASGEMMDPDKMTAAHRTLPFGTEVTVVNRGNGRSAVVRINDRGPFVHGRVLDLSPAAGRALGVSGLAPVSLIVGGGRHDESNHKPEQSPPPELVAEESRFAAGPPGP